MFVSHLDALQHVLDAQRVQEEQDVRPPAPVRPAAHAALQVLYVRLPRTRLHLSGLLVLFLKDFSRSLPSTPLPSPLLSPLPCVDLST